MLKTCPTGCPPLAEKSRDKKDITWTVNFTELQTTSYWR